MKNALILISWLSFTLLQAQSGYLFYTGGGQKEILRMDSTGNPETLTKGYLYGGSDITFDQFEEKIYWTIINNQFQECSDGQLFRANTDGTEIELILESDRFYQNDINGFGMPITVDSPNDNLYLLADGDLIRVKLSTLEVTELTDNSETKGDFYLDQKHQKIFFTTYGGINVYDIATEESEFLFSFPYPGPLAVDTVSNHIYCSRLVMGTGTVIYRTDLAGTVLDTIKSPVSKLENMFIDQESELLYWNESNTIHRSELNGDNEEIIWEEIDANNLKLTFDPVQQEIYWVWPDQTPIQKSSPDFVTPQIVIDHNMRQIQDIVIDESNSLLYWADADGKVFSADYHFNTINTIPLNQPASPAEIALDDQAGMIYWSDFQDNQIHRASLLDGQVEIWSDEAETLFAHYYTHLQLDSETDELFWYDPINSALQKTSLEEYNPLTLYTEASIVGKFALDKLNQKVLWLSNEPTAIRLMAMNYDGSGLETLPQNEPLTGSIRGVHAKGEQIILTKNYFNYNFLISNDGGQHFYSWNVPCQPGEIQIAGDFFIPSLVDAETVHGTSDFQIFPNPAGDYIQLTFDESSMVGDNLQAMLYSSEGKRVANYPVNSTNETIDLFAIPGGLYYLQVVSEKGHIYATRRFVVISK